MYRNWLFFYGLKFFVCAGIKKKIDGFLLQKHYNLEGLSDGEIKSHEITD